MRLHVQTVRQSHIRAFTGLTVKQLGELTGGLWEVRPDRGRGRRWSLGFPDRVFLVVLALRTNLTYEQLASLFGVSDTTVCRVVADLTPHIAGLLGPAPADRRELWIVDGTPVPARDRAITAKAKSYRRSVNVQVVCRWRDGAVCAVGRSMPGIRNDVVVYRQTMAGLAAGHRRLIGDGGYRSAAGVTSQARGRDGRIVRDRNWRRSRRRRARVEHVLARMQQWRVLRDCRRPDVAIDTITRAVAALHNLTLAQA